MSVLVEKGTFTKINTVATQTVNLSNSSLTPKAIILWGAQVTANGTYNEGLSWHYGFSDGTNDACMSWVSEDATDPTDTGNAHWSSAVINMYVPTDSGSTQARADLSSFAAGQFTLNWSINSSSSWVIHYMVIGGAGITNAFVLNTTAGTTSTGNASYNGVGFQGNFVHAIVGSIAGATAQAINTLGAGSFGAAGYIGAATSSSARWCLGIADDDGINQGGGTSTVAFRYYQNDKFLIAYNNNDGSVNCEADFVSFIPDGITINWTDAPGATGLTLAFLVIAGGTWDVGDFAGNNTTNNQTVSITSGATPRGLMIFSDGDTTTDSGATGEAHCRITIGGTDGTNQGCIWGGSQDTTSPMITARISLTDALIRTATTNATATSTTTDGEADIASFATPGQYEIDWTDAIDQRFAWFTVSEAAAAAADEERYMAVNTIPSLSYPPTMNDLLAKIGGSRTNVTTFQLQSQLPEFAR